jgi:hypothetical protein
MYIVACMRECMTYKTGSGLGDWIYWHIIHSTRDYRQLERYRCSTHFTCHRYTRTRFFESSLAISWQRIYNSRTNFKSHMKSFLWPNPFLTIILQLPIPKTQLNTIPSTYPGRLTSRNSTLHSRPFTLILLDNHFARTPRKTLSSLVPYCFRRV